MRSFSEYLDVKTEPSFHPYNNNGEDKIFGTLILTSVINYPEVVNLNSRLEVRGEK